MADDLFTAKGAAGEDSSPLADRMRPRALEDIVGQDHIVGPGRLLRRAIQADRLSSVIFYGPPGTGKTSLARVIANTTRASFESLNAVLAGIKDIREAIDRADERRRLYGRRTILFVDEVHRWNKAQQDALLPWVENGTVILVGATTENPFFEVNRALVSRSRVFQLKPLGQDELMETARRTMADRERGYGRWKLFFEKGALEHLVEIAGGDARSLLNAMELAVETSGAGWPPPEGADIRISLEAAEESIQRRALLYDRDGDYHFDTISAFIKSVRGSDPDGALYWLAKMIRAGEDPGFIFRRMIILAGEDVGLADPNAIGVVMACAQAFDRIGFPEGNFPLVEACLYLATAPKSNSALNFFDVMKEVEKEDAEVPNHLRDASRDGDSFGHGEGYIYPHAYRDHWAAQQYLPSGLVGKLFYMPSRMGYEGKIREEVLRKRELQAAIILGDGDRPGDGEILTWSASSKGREGWFKRLESGRSGLLLADRNRILGAASIRRHDRILIGKGDDGLLLWESLRRAPEGLVSCLVESPGAKETLLRYAGTLDEEEQPRIAVVSPVREGSSGPLPAPEEAEQWFGCAVYDHILSREPWRRLSRTAGAGSPGPSGPAAARGGVSPPGPPSNPPPVPGPDPAGIFGDFAAGAYRLLAPGGAVVVQQSPPRLGERISRFIGAEGLAKKLRKAEEAFFNGNSSLFWEGETLESAFREAGFELRSELVDQSEERLITATDLGLWFDAEHSRWGNCIRAALGDRDFKRLEALTRERALQGPLTWKWKCLLVTARKG
jgi:putative ATPase